MTENLTSPYQEEKHLMTFKSGVLTTHRIRSSGDKTQSSILLQNIAMVETTTHEKLIYLFIGIVCALVGIVVMDSTHFGEEGFLAGVLIGGLFIGAYFFTKKHVIAIYSKGAGVMKITTQGMKSGDIDSFVKSVEREVLKHQGVESVY